MIGVRGVRRRGPVVALVVAVLAGCGAGGDDPAAEASPGATSVAPSSSAMPTTAASPDSTWTPGPDFDQALHDELIQMLEDDQRERAEADPGQWKDRERADRLDEILTEHGWPTFDLVGEDGEDAAWAIAQHADHDVEFQRRALDLLHTAVEDGQGSPGNLAYLTDRVALNSDEKQIYGTQAGCEGATAAPAPLEDPDDVDARRAEVGLPPLQDYLDEITQFCGEA